jgi:nucleoid-associated protein YgaU
MSHFEKVGVIFITGLVAIILALSLFGSGKQDPEDAVALQEPAPFDAAPRPHSASPARPEGRGTASRGTRGGADASALWEAVGSPDASGGGRPAGRGTERASRERGQGARRAGPVASSPALAPLSLVASERAPEEFQHVVAPRESYYDLARRYYRDGSKWQLIQSRNNVAPDRLRPGMRIAIPPLPATPAANVLLASAGRASSDGADSPSAGSISDEASGAALRSYKVKRGDTLSHIAQAHLGTVKAVGKLEEANRDVLRDGLLREGMVLRIP